ncbi:hypothetical protein [Enterobacter mori]|uniref:hypothetical protein n=1 Tax=Enterobacter mori TaxID=539813 RepID=UPI0039799343
MQDWFVSWKYTKDEKNCGYQIFESSHKDPALVLSEQVKYIASINEISPHDVLVIAFNKV